MDFLNTCKCFSPTDFFTESNFSKLSKHTQMMQLGVDLLLHVYMDQLDLDWPEQSAHEDSPHGRL